MARKRKRRSIKLHKAGARKRKRSHAKRRRSNPGVPVLFANPRRRRRRRGSAAAARRRRHRQYVAAKGGGRSRSRRANPHRRHRLHRTHRPKLHRRRRSNPGRLRLGKLGSYIKIGIFGGLGVVTARIGSQLYTSYLKGTVSGGETTGARAWLSEGARLLSMGALTLAGEKALTMAKISPQYRMAYKIGGLAETGRQMIGVAVAHLAPSSNLSSYGLSGGYDPYVASAYGLSGPTNMDPRGSGYFGPLGEIEEVDSYLGEVEEVDSFNGHPYAQ